MAFNGVVGASRLASSFSHAGLLLSGRLEFIISTTPDITILALVSLWSIGFIPAIDTLDYYVVESAPHGDIKPRNVLVEENYDVKLRDFDSSRVTSNDNSFPCDPTTMKSKFSPEWASLAVFNGSYDSAKACFSID